MFLLYENEKNVVKNSNKILKDYAMSPREKKKKIFELFHFLVFLEIIHLKKFKIIPNEPGDFILEKNNKRYLVEVTTVFGNKEEHIKMNNILCFLFDFEHSEGNNNQMMFHNHSMKTMFLKKLKDKQAKNYTTDIKVDKSFLLIVTGEYDNCPVTGSWFLKFLQENEIMVKKTFDKIWILDYFSSGKDSGPIAIKDFYSEFIEYKKIISLSKNL